MRGRIVRALFLVAFVLNAAGLALAQAHNPTRAEEMAESLIAERINTMRLRLAPDAPPLRSDPELVRIARARSAALASGAPFAHYDHAGNLSAVDMVQEKFGPYGAIGENIATETNTAGFDSAGFARRMSENWLASEHHRENILSPKYDSSGIGVVVVGQHAYATQIFRGPPPPPRRVRQPLRQRNVGGVWGDGF